MKTLMRKIVAAACLMAGLSAFAEDYGWANEATKAQEWQTLANWTNATGAVATAIPGTADDNVLFPSLGATLRQVTLFNGSVSSFTLGSLTGGAYWNLTFNSKEDTWGSAGRTLTLPSIKDFDGRFTAAAGRSTIAITGTGTDNRLADVKPTSRLFVSVADANAAVKVENVTGNGVIGKKGAGKMTLGTVQDNQLQVFADAGTVCMDNPGVEVFRAADATVALDVPAGRTTRIETLIVGGTSVKKTGAGTLVVGRLSPTNATVALEGGKVAFAPTIRTIPTDAPATTPQFHYDADAEDTVVTNEQGVVTEWHDARQTYATARQATCGGGSPTIDTTALPGHKVVDFPVGTYGSMPSKVGSGYAFQWSAFVVFRFTTETAAAGYNVLGAGDIKLTSNSYLFLRPDRAPANVSGGVYTVDGVPVDPFAERNGAFKAGQWHVAAFVGPNYGSYNKIAYCGGSSGSNGGKGGMQIAEVITYARSLTADERRATEAYLLNKWLGKAHPDTLDENSPSFTCAEDVPAIIESDSDMTVGSVTGGDGSLVKRGSGDATVSAELADTFTTLTVEGGSLAVTTESKPKDRSVFHFDASKADTLTYKVVTEESGAESTNVTQWTDVRSNGMTARAYIVDTPERKKDSEACAVTNPVLTHVETAAGKAMPLIDFGHMSVRAGSTPVYYNDSAAFRLYKDGSPINYANIVESHIIWCPAHNTQGSFFGAVYPWNDYYRGDSWIFSNTACGQVKNGRIEVNGVAKKYNNAVTTDVHLLSTVPTSGTHVGYMCYQANNGGGCLIGEVLGFTETMTEKERTYVKGALMNKWLGGTAPAWTNDLTAITVAAGSTLTAAGGVLSAPTITGGGTIDAAKVADIATLNLTAPDRRTVNGLTVEGEADFAGPVTVNLAGGANLKPGTYTLVSATSLANVDLSKWTLNGAPTKYQYVLKKVGNSVVLEVKKRGLFIFIN